MDRRVLRFGGTMMKRLLMVAYHFPPLAGSSGIQRTLRFVRHLPRFGWQPLVLTADPRAYERTSEDLLAEVPPDTVVERAFALDTARHLSVRGRYLGALARPDRWMTWQLGAVPAGLRLIRRYRPAALWTTYPIATAHVIGRALQRWSGLPWIADFRDPMAQDGYPADPLTWRSFKRIEESVMENARCAVFTTPGAARVYRQRYPAAAGKIEVIENGFDEESFSGQPGPGEPRDALNPGAVTVLHSGVVYPSERDPTRLFEALGKLVSAGALDGKTFRLRFRAASHDELLRGLARINGVEDLVELLPPVGYRAALDEMVRADGLLVLQASNCNEQIPAKLYEYLRAGRPILALTDPGGDTAQVVREAGLDTIAGLDCADEIAGLLMRFVRRSQSGELPLPDAGYVARASRRGRTADLVTLLDAAAQSAG